MSRPYIPEEVEEVEVEEIENIGRSNSSSSTSSTSSTSSISSLDTSSFTGGAGSSSGSGVETFIDEFCGNGKGIGPFNDNFALTLGVEKVDTECYTGGFNENLNAGVFLTSNGKQLVVVPKKYGNYVVDNILYKDMKTNKIQACEYAALCVCGGRIFIYGGYKPDTKTYDPIMHEVNLTRNDGKQKFKLTSLRSWDLSQYGVEPRYGHTLTRAGNNTSVTMALYGGEGENGHCEAIHIIKVEESGKIEVKTPKCSNPPPALAFHAAALWHDEGHSYESLKIIVAGGRLGSLFYPPNFEIWQFTLNGSSWKKIGTLKERHMYFGMAIQRDMLIVLAKNTIMFDLKSQKKTEEGKMNQYTVNGQDASNELHNNNAVCVSSNEKYICCHTDKKKVFYLVIDRPVRIAVIGVTGRGKSSHCNAFVDGPGYPRKKLQEDYKFAEGDTDTRITTVCEGIKGILSDNGVIEIIDQPGLEDSEAKNASLLKEIKSHYGTTKVVDAMVLVIYQTWQKEETAFFENFAPLFHHDSLFQRLFVFVRIEEGEMGDDTPESIVNIIYEKLHTISKGAFTERERILFVDSHKDSEQSRYGYSQVIDFARTTGHIRFNHEAESCVLL